MSSTNIFSTQKVESKTLGKLINYQKKENWANANATENGENSI